MSTWDMEPPPGSPSISELITQERTNITTESIELPIPEHSEEALALSFSDQFGDDLRYVAANSKWFAWTGQLWRPDETLAVFDKVRGVCRAAAAESNQNGTATRLAQCATVAAVERLARADRRHAATVDQWDGDMWALNTPAGVVDLRTGNVRPANRTDYCRKITAVGPDGDCPLWRCFLDRVTGGDRLLQAFIQRMCGYILTGSTREHALFFLYGTGSNGKSVFVRTLAGILADYARTAPIETLIATTHQQHPTDIAGLHGARLVTAVETEDGRRWAESKLKALTGGDRIAARFMRQDYFEFTPVFKLVVAGNHKPGLGSVDESIRRRFNLVPLTVQIPKEERDEELPEKLRAEYGGILQWMLEGCLEWQRAGLNAPAAVLDATETYLQAEDLFGRWIDDCCAIPKSYCWTGTKALFENWSTWCERNHEHAGSERRFSQTLEVRGFQPKRTENARGFLCIELREDSLG